MTTAPKTMPYPRPQPDALTQAFWDGVQQHKLVMQQCQSCHKFVHWPQEICRFCLSADLTYTQVSGRATLYSYAIAVHPYHPGLADRVPYTLASVELVEQERLRMVTNIVECPEDRLEIGMQLEVVFVEVDPGLTLPLFKPASG